MKRLFALLTFAFLLFGCGKEKCGYDECSVTAPAAEIQSLQSYLSSNGIAATQHCSGIFYTVNNAGNGDELEGCENVSVNYEGKLTNGTVFDKTNPGQPASFNLGGLIPGFRNGVLQIKTGGRVTIYIPPSLGYGSQANGSIPANSNLIFTVDLLAAE